MPDFKAKMHQIRFRLRLRPDPAGGAYSVPPDPLAGFQGAASRQGGGRERDGEREGMGREGKRRVGKGEKGNGGKGEGKMGGTGQGMGWGRERRKGREREERGYSPPNFNSCRRH